MLLVHLGKDRENLGKPAVGNELLGAVEHIVTAVFGEHRRRLGAECVAAGARFGQAIGRTPLTGGDLFQVLFFLFGGSVIDKRQRSDAGVGRIGHGK